MQIILIATIITVAIWKVFATVFGSVLFQWVRCRKTLLQNTGLILCFKGGIVYLVSTRQKSDLVVSFQREERDDEILIFVIDGSYGNEGEFVDISKYESEMAYVTAASAAYRKALESEFSVDFEEVNIGPGADLPAFVTAVSENVVPLIPWLLAVFFSGKPLVDNIKAWRTIFSKLKPYFSRPVVFNRHGAAVIAVDAVFIAMDGLPKSIKLLSYSTGYRYDDDEPAADNDAQVEDAEPTLSLSNIKHVFKIEADGVTFLVTVDGKDAIATRLRAG